MPRTPRSTRILAVASLAAVTLTACVRSAGVPVNPAVAAVKSTAPSTEVSAPSAAVAASPSHGDADGHFGLDDATFTVPAFHHSMSGRPCPSGRMTFHQGGTDYTDTSNGVRIEDAVRADVTGDGVSDIVAQLACGQEATLDQVSLIGQVMDASGGPITVTRLATHGGAITLTAVDGVWCCEGTDAGFLHQDRTFQWNGAAFTQTSGHATFALDPATPLAVHLTPLVFDYVGGVWRGSMTVTVRNTGAARLEDVSVMFEAFPNAVGQRGLHVTGCPHLGDARAVCALGDIPVSASRSATITWSLLHVTAKHRPKLVSGGKGAQVRIGDRALPFRPVTLAID